MKKTLIVAISLVLTLGLGACSSKNGKSAKETAVSTESSSEKKDKKMKEMEKDLDEKGIEISINSINDMLTFTREKGIDYDYFTLMFDIINDPDEVRNILLQIKGSVSGKEKPTLYYKVSKDRIVENPVQNTNINTIADVLKSLDYSDKEILEFAQWYYNNNEE